MLCSEGAAHLVTDHASPPGHLRAVPPEESSTRAGAESPAGPNGSEGEDGGGQEGESTATGGQGAEDTQAKARRKGRVHETESGGSVRVGRQGWVVVC